MAARSVQALDSKLYTPKKFLTSALRVQHAFNRLKDHNCKIYNRKIVLAAVPQVAIGKNQRTDNA